MPSRAHRFFTAVLPMLAIGLLIPHSLSPQSIPHPANIEHLRLGQSAIPLYGPWKFPSATRPSIRPPASPSGPIPASTTRIGKTSTSHLIPEH